MEEMCKRFLIVSVRVLNNLEDKDKSLPNIRVVSREISYILNKDRFFCTRIIGKYYNNIQECRESWLGMKIGKTPVDIVNQLQYDVDRFFELFDYDGDLKPRHIAAEQSHLDLCEYIIEKTKDQNPRRYIAIYLNFLDKNPMKINGDQQKPQNVEAGTPEQARPGTPQQARPGPDHDLPKPLSTGYLSTLVKGLIITKGLAWKKSMMKNDTKIIQLLESKSVATFGEGLNFAMNKKRKKFQGTNE